MTDRFIEATDEVTGWIKMLAERGHGELAAELAQRASAIMEETFKPLSDFAEGRITWDEYHAEMVARREAEQKRAQLHYMTTDPAELIIVRCEECAREHDWIPDEHDGEWPPIYFECEDETGESCVEEEKDDDED
jgi:hypothetical protein